MCGCTDRANAIKSAAVAIGERNPRALGRAVNKFNQATRTDMRSIARAIAARRSIRR